MPCISFLSQQPAEPAYKAFSDGLWRIEGGLVYGPTLPLDAENPNVVIGGYLRKYPGFRCLLHPSTFLHI